MVMILANNLAKLEIMIKGAELSSKLNSIGVVNEFGKKSEGKQDLTEIIDLAIPMVSQTYTDFDLEMF